MPRAERAPRSIDGSGWSGRWMRKGRGEDQVYGDDRGDHQCRDLPADTPEVEKPEQLHDQPFAGIVTASTRA